MSDVTPSISSDSVSFPTELENLPESHVNTPPENRQQKSAVTAEESGVKEEVLRMDGAREQEARKEEGVQDLRVFELNSDSGKSTPSTNGKKGRA